MIRRTVSDFFLHFAVLAQPKDRSVYPKNAHVRGLDHVTLRLWGIEMWGNQT